MADLKIRQNIIGEDFIKIVHKYVDMPIIAGLKSAENDTNKRANHKYFSISLMSKYLAIANDFVEYTRKHDEPLEEPLSTATLKIFQATDQVVKQIIKDKSKQYNLQDIEVRDGVIVFRMPLRPAWQVEAKESLNSGNVKAEQMGDDFVLSDRNDSLNRLKISLHRKNKDDFELTLVNDEEPSNSSFIINTGCNLTMLTEICEHLEDFLKDYFYEQKED